MPYKGSRRDEPSSSWSAGCAAAWATSAARNIAELRTKARFVRISVGRAAREPRARRDHREGSAELPGGVGPGSGSSWAVHGDAKPTESMNDIHARRSSSSTSARSTRSSSRGASASWASTARSTPAPPRPTAIRAFAPARRSSSPAGRPASTARGARAPTGRLRAGRAGARHLLRAAAHGRTSWAARSSGATHREYGPATVDVKASSPPLPGAPRRELDVWMSHGDRVEALPPGFEPMASTPHAPFAAVEDRAAQVLRRPVPPRGGPHAARQGGALELRARRVRLHRQLVDARPSPRWRSSRSAPRWATGSVICALSGGRRLVGGGAALHRAIGDRLRCIFVDNGVLRAGRARAGRGRLRARCSTCRSSPSTPRSAS